MILACAFLPKVQRRSIHKITGKTVAQMVEHGTSNAKIMGLIPRESKSW